MALRTPTTKGDAVLHVYCKDGTKAMLKALAKRHKRSLSAEVQYLISQAHECEVGSKPGAGVRAVHKRKLI